MAYRRQRNATLAQLGQQSVQRRVRLLGQTHQQPVSFASKHKGPVAAHWLGRRASPVARARCEPSRRWQRSHRKALLRPGRTCSRPPTPPHARVDRERRVVPCMLAPLAVMLITLPTVFVAAIFCRRPLRQAPIHPEARDSRWSRRSRPTRPSAGATAKSPAVRAT